MRKFILNNFRILSMLLTADITFSGTTTSPVILFLQKTNSISNYNYKIMIVQSPKYSNPTGTKMKTKEVEFLGYEFSNNRSKAGIDVKKDSILSKIVTLNHEFIIKNEVTIPETLSNYVRIVKLNDIILNKNNDNPGDIYPKYCVIEGKPLKELGVLNKWDKDDFNQLPREYIEISNMETLKLEKTKNTNRFCKAGDIILSSLNPTRAKIVKVDRDLMLSPAIHVFTPFDSNMTDIILNELKKDYVLNQMNALLDGFKVTYAKISEENLLNNIKIKI